MDPWSLALGAAGGVALSLVARNFTTSEKKVAKLPRPEFGVRDDRFVRLMTALMGTPLLPGNRIEALQNGDEIFPAMLAAIRSAERTICFETYIYWTGDIGRAFSEALAERARAGVRVHVVLDGLGTGSLDHELIKAMESAGAEVERYHPVTWRTMDRMNHRTHRKLLIIDGRVGFTGGVGIADQWLGHAQDREHWRDSHYRVEGPVVAQLQATFIDNWIKTRAEALHGDAYFPRLEPAGPFLAQVSKSSPDEGSESARLMYLLSIACARRSIRIANSYFVPDKLSRDALVAAAYRGVAIEIMVPGPIIDTRLTRRASRSLWGPLLRAGVAIHEYQPTMLHCKTMIIDDAWSSVGSTNFDHRSFRLNDEANLNVYDPAFAEGLTRVFAADLADARRISLEEWRHRPLGDRAKEAMASLLRTQV